MATKQLQDLKLSEKQAEEIIELGIQIGAVEGDEMPDSKKEKISAATEVVASALDAWVEDEIRPGDEEADVAEAGERIANIFEIAGIAVDDDGEVNIGGESDDDNGGDDSDEQPFDPDDYIEGYSELSVVTKLARVKKLDPEDEDDVAVLNAIADWENEQDKPSSRVLNYIDETLGTDDNGGDDETADEAGDGDASEEPWDGYDKMSAADIRKVLKEASEDKGDPLTADQVEYVRDYEQAREKPPARKRVLDYCNALLEELKGADSSDDEPEEEKPARGRGRGRAAKQEEPANGSIVLTRDQILTALAEGEVEIAV